MLPFYVIAFTLHRSAGSFPFRQLKSNSLRRIRPLTGILSFLALISALTPAQAATDGFDPRFNHNVYATAVHPDGSVIVGGAFTTVQSAGGVQETAHSYLARILPDGRVDESFDVHLDGDVTALLIDRDGRIVIGGKFTRYLSRFTPAWVERRGLARLNVDGSLDDSFATRATGNPTAGSPIYALALQADGKILIGGAFTALQGANDAAPVSRQRLARLLPDGAIDPSFDVKSNNWVYAILVQADQRIVVGGGFTTLQAHGTDTAVERRRMARLNLDGSLDPDFRPRADNRVLTLAQQADGKIIAGGDFRSLQTDADESAITRNFLARIRPDGSIDGDYDPNPNASVAVVLSQRDGSLLAAGSFTAFRPSSGSLVVSYRYVARILPDGSIDEGFVAAPNAAVTSLSLQANDQIILGGVFTGLQEPNATTPTTRMRLARVHANGTLDTAFGTDATELVTRIVRQADGKWLVGGAFTQFAGITRSNLARIESNGTLDLSFNPVINGRVDSIAVQADGKILVGGAFTTVNSVDRTYLSRLNSDGSLDTSFHPQPIGAVYSILVQSDGKILLGGAFTSFDPDDNDDTAVVARSFLARLNADGSLDTGFQPAANGSVYSLTLQADGKLIVAGDFTTLQGTGQSAENRGYIGRLNADATLDTAFNPNPNASVYHVTLQTDGSLVLSGNFSSLNPNPVQNPSATAVLRARVARIASDGKVDTTFDPNPNGPVTTTFVDATGRVYLGGTFLTLGPTVRQRFVRLLSNGSVDSSFELNANESVLNIASDPAGNLLLAGSFTALQAPGVDPVSADDHLALLDANGDPVRTFRVQVGADYAGAVNSLSFQIDGQVLAGGTFTDLAGGSNTHLARFSATGTPDATFAPRPDGTVHTLLVQPESVPGGRGKLFAWLNPNGGYYPDFALTSISHLSGQITAVVVQSDGRVVVGGSFTDKAAGAGYQLARYWPDGSVDTSFNPAPDGMITALAVQSDGKLLVGGTFINIAGTVRHRVARLNADGSIDTGFNPKASGQVNSFAVQSDGRILIGGTFVSLDPNSTDDADVDVTTRNYLARLNADGTVDTSFTLQTNGTVRTIKLLESGQILIGGAFSTIGDQTRNGLARIGTGGAVESFNPNILGTVASIGVQSDGRIVVGGNFSTVNPNTTDTTTAITRNNLARLNTDGTLDSGFDPNANSVVESVLITTDQQIYIAGSFTTLTPNSSSQPVVRNRIARLNTDGTIDTGFNPNANGMVATLLPGPNESILLAGSFTALHPESVIWVGGEFNQIGGITAPRLARLNLDGNGDSNFLPQPNASVKAMALRTDGSILVSGNFTEIGGATRAYLARFSSSGVLNPAFAAAPNGPVSALAQDGNGRILIGGDFTQVSGTSRSRLARLTADGALDTAFAVSVNGGIHAIVPLRDGRVLVAGSFTEISGSARTGLARLQPNGSIDTSFNANLDGEVSSLQLQADGNILVGGAFSHVGSEPRAGFARLTSEGAIDSSVSVQTNGEVRAIASSIDGTPLIGGTFTEVDSRARLLLARVNTGATSVESVSVSADLQSITWSRLGSGPELTSASLAFSADGLSWTSVGVATRVTGSRSWVLQLSSALPSQSTYYLRTEGIAPTNRQGSSGLIARTWQFFGTTAAGAIPLFTLEDTIVDGEVIASDGGSSGSNGSSGENSGGISTGEDGTTGGLSGEINLIPSRLINLSARVAIRGNEVIIVGFHIAGNKPQRVLLRAIGPGLQPFGVSDSAIAPQLELFSASGTSLKSASSWTNEDAQVFAQVGAFGLTSGAGDAALTITLDPGSYTVHARDRQGLGGTLLIEAYAAASTADESAVLSSLSTRGMTAPGSGVLTAGLVLHGQTSRAFLLRGIGPTLEKYGVTDTVSDPVLRIFDVTGQLIAMNDNWSADTSQIASIQSAASATGAFTLPTASTDSALVVTLAPGAYTLQLTDRLGNVGDSLIEVYALDN